MELIYGEELLSYMKKKNKKVIVLDVATANTSDVEVTEPFLRFASEASVDYLIEKKKFKKMDAPCGIFLRPEYRLAYEDRVTIDMKKVLCFHKFIYSGIKL